MKLEIGEIYKTRASDQVCIDGFKDGKFKGRLYNFDGKEYIGEWLPNGVFALSTTPESEEWHTIIGKWDN